MHAVNCGQNMFLDADGRGCEPSEPPAYVKNGQVDRAISMTASRSSGGEG